MYISSHILYNVRQYVIKLRPHERLNLPRLTSFLFRTVNICSHIDLDLRRIQKNLVTICCSSVR